MEEKKKTVRTIYDSIYKHRKLVGILMITLLILANILLFMHVLPIFEPVRKFLGIITAPILVAVIFFYIFKPIYQKLLKLKLSPTLATTIVFLLIISVFVLAFAIMIPAMNAEIGKLLNDFPGYWSAFVSFIEQSLINANIGAFQEQFQQLITNATTALTDNIGNIITESVTGVRSFLSSLISFGITLFTFPIILYYLFRDGKKLPNAIINLLPTRVRPMTGRLFADIDQQLSLYIRGQILVCFWVGVMFFIGYSIIGLPYALLLAFFAGILNIIPYLGSFIAIIPSMIIGIADSPVLFLQVLIVFAIEQTIESRVISPKVLGDNLQVHPITILIVLLTAGRLYGVAGVIIG
ncbi:MAG TPA: AI-2E family transporter, partial [Erysipelothrix sp.]|nr:AI-2E family transporter [Erysipelothrix sp.]